jgi:anti-anti-sigma factor
MSIETEDTPHCTVIRLAQSQILGMSQLQTLQQALEQVMANQPARGILLDCAALEAVSSAFLGHLVQWKQKATAAGTELKLCALRPIVQQVFQMSRLDQRFTILPNRGEGLDSFAPGA